MHRQPQKRYDKCLMINLNKTNNPFTTTVKITPTETAETKFNSPGVYTHFKHTSVTITEMNTTHLKLCVDSNKFKVIPLLVTKVCKKSRYEVNPPLNTSCNFINPQIHGVGPISFH